MKYFTDEDRYIEFRLNWFDRFCLWTWVVPAAMVFVLIGNGMAGEPLDRMVLLWVFMVSFVVTIILRAVVLQLRIKKFRDEYWNKPR